MAGKLQGLSDLDAGVLKSRKVDGLCLFHVQRELDLAAVRRRAADRIVVAEQAYLRVDGAGAPAGTSMGGNGVRVTLTVLLRYS